MSTTQWRATGPYIASSALSSGILAETQLFLRTYDEQEGSAVERVESTRQLLVDGLLPQRSRFSRKTIVSRIARRLTNWSPPGWVLDDLAEFATQSSTLSLKAALLVHVCRQDRLLYDLVQKLIGPMWREGQKAIDSADVQGFLDAAVGQHPEIESWTRQTRGRLGTITLSILRDYGLLTGKARKQIVEPIVPGEVADHVVRLLDAEGVSDAEIPLHSDWRLWLWDEARARRTLADRIDS